MFGVTSVTNYRPLVDWDWRDATVIVVMTTLVAASLNPWSRCEGFSAEWLQSLQRRAHEGFCPTFTDT